MPSNTVSSWDGAAMSDEKTLLMDANIVISYYLDRGEKFALVSDMINKAMDKGVVLLYPVHCVKDLFYTIAADSKRVYRLKHNGELTESAASCARSFAWACVENLTEIALAVGADHSDVWLAQKQRRLHSDFEDDMVIAAAMRSKAVLLVTQDKQLAANAPVATADVAKALEWLETL